MDASKWSGGACCAPVARELVPASGLFFSDRWRFEAPLSLGVRTLAPREMLVTVCKEKGEDAARLHERIMNGRTDQDVDELQRIATILDPASVIPLIPALAGRSFDAHRRVLFSSPWSRQERITCYKGAASVGFVGGHCGLQKGAFVHVH